MVWLAIRVGLFGHGGGLKPRCLSRSIKVDFSFFKISNWGIKLLYNVVGFCHTST